MKQKKKTEKFALNAYETQNSHFLSFLTKIPIFPQNSQYLRNRSKSMVDVILKQIFALNNTGHD